MPLSPEEKELLLQHESFIAEVLARREVATKSGPSKPRWQRFLESTGGTAIITVLLGGIVGSIITGMIQRGAKDREFQQTWMNARGNQALVAYKEYLDKEQEVVNSAHELIGSSISVSDNLIALTGDDFDLDRFSGADKETVRKQKIEIRKKYGDTNEQWESERVKIGLLMSYYHHLRPGDSNNVAKAWDAVQNSVTEYMNCAQQWYENYMNCMTDGNKKCTYDSTKIKNACKEKKDEILPNLEQLSNSLETARQYAWEGWESPDKLRVILEGTPR